MRARAPFSKRAPRADDSKASPADAPPPSAGAGRAPAGGAADLRVEEVWEPLDGEEVADTLQGAFGTLEELVAPEFKLSDERAKKIGARWAKLANSWAKRTRSALAIKAVVYGSLCFAFLELTVMLSWPAVKALVRVRKEAGEKKKAETIPGRVVPITRDAEGGGGGT